ncbi:IDEAL domain-containing protein [Cytobacillus oceanisediminis]|uniref:IDEAL domain-containing protein n=1 Tax=Cytobacillus oceanisediminis TaxID=665099 RepID=UPI001C22FDEE|nr:IDEAL domain-containing protein [Cytobacillus oceanisediminis]MBU8773208.1 IDEAL domain-containing protein [Cytobacillus oceanisediminis]
METSKKSFSKGEWIKVINTRLIGYTGYLINRLLEDGYKVKLTKDPKGNSIDAIIWIGAEDIVSCENKVEEDDLLAMIDFALATNDKQWFLELTAQLPEELPF